MTVFLLAWSLRRLARPDPVQSAWRAFCRKLAARGVERAPHEGPRDFAERAARALPAARRAILRIGALYIALRYGARGQPDAAPGTCGAWCASSARHERPANRPGGARLCAAGRRAGGDLRRARRRCRRSSATWRSATASSSSELKLRLLAGAARRPGARGDQAAAGRSACAPGRSTAASSSPSGASPRARSSGRSTAARSSAPRRTTACRRSTSSPSSASRPSTAATPAAGAWSTRSPRSPSTTRRAPTSSAASSSSTCCSRASAGIDVFSVRGSYAGAIGIPQFMPSSARRYAVDFDGNGAIDLRRSRRRRHRQRRQFPQGARLAARRRRAARGARRRATPGARYADGSVEPKHSHGRPARRPACEFDSPRARRRARRRWSSCETPEQAERLPRRAAQLLRAHALQPQRALRRGGRRPRAGS